MCKGNKEATDVQDYFLSREGRPGRCSENIVFVVKALPVSHPQIPCKRERQQHVSVIPVSEAGMGRSLGWPASQAGQISGLQIQ